MKTSFKLWAAAAVAVVSLASCSQEELFDVQGEGRVFLSATLNSDVKVRSRAEVDDLRESCTLWISNSKGLVRQFDTLADLPDEGVKLLTGSYVAEAWAGDSVPASFTDRYFKGREDFTITKGGSVAVEVTCKIANTVVAVNYDDNISSILSDVTMTVGHSQGSLDFAGETASSKGYFMMNSRDKDLTYTLTGKLHSGETYTRTGTITDCQPATQYTLNVHCQENTAEIGGAYLTIEIDESEIVVEDEITIYAAPSIRGYNFDLSEAIRAEKGTVGRRSIFITTSSAITSVLLSSDVFADKLGIEGNDFDIFRMASDFKPTIEAAGINYEYTYDDVNDEAQMKINFEEEFTNALENGDYAITVTVTDANGKSATGVLTIIVSDAQVATGSCDEASVWATRATITGIVSKSDAPSPRMVYRKLGTSAWTDATTTISGSQMTANLTDLTPGTTYEYTAATDEFYSADVKSFTTESASQFPNSGFEDWCYDSKTRVVAASTDSKFWDSGNYGSAPLAGVNITEPDESIKHGGNYSICLKSQFVGLGILGAFAAGNVFVGEFIRTDGTNGVLGFGREWTSRPTKLRGWVKYTPGTVNYTSSSYTDLQSGDTDHGVIYIALLDDSQSGTDSGKTYPVIIKTKSSDRSLFDSNASNVIAYGKLEFTAATDGSGLVEFEIPIEYRNTSIKPSYIMCTASSSIGGDYFVGSTGSTMWLDDLELVYE